MVPLEVSICMHTRRVPPTRTSILATGMVAPEGPYQAAKCSGSVHIRHTRSAGAWIVRCITTVFFALRSSVIVLPHLVLVPELSEVVVHAVEARLPNPPVPLRPVRNRFERRDL